MDQFIMAATVMNDDSDIGFPSRGECDDYLSGRRILFDSCANRSIIRNPDLLVELEDCDTHDVEKAFGVSKRHFSMKGKIVIAGIAHVVYVDTGARDNIISAGRFEEACIVHKYAVVKPPRRSLSDDAIAAQIIDGDGIVVFTIYGSGHMSAFDYPEPISVI